MKFEKNIHHFQPGGSKKWRGLLQSILLKKAENSTIQNLGRAQQSLWIKGVWASDTLTLTGT